MLTNTIQTPRSGYGQISLDQLDTETLAWLRQLVLDAGTRPDAHGSWDFRAEFDSKGRGSAINWDLYAIGQDMHDGQPLAIIQVRRYEKAHKNWYPSVRKNYFLLGRNEDSTAWAHPIPPQVVRYAINHKTDAILAAQNWMFGGDYSRLLRQGDIALLPVKLVSGEEAGTEGTVATNHHIVARHIRIAANRTYAQDPTIDHPQHPTIAARGWYRILVAERARYWKFAPPTRD